MTDTRTTRIARRTLGRLRHAVGRAGIVVALTLAAVTLAPAGQEPAVTAIIAGIVAVGLTGSLLGYSWMAPRLGRATAWAGLVVAWAALFTLMFALTPDCYTSIQPHRCEPRELATWTVSGALLPLVALLVGYLPARGTALTFRLVRRLTGWTLGTRPTAAHTAAADDRDGAARTARAHDARSGNPARRARTQGD